MPKQSVRQRKVELNPAAERRWREFVTELRRIRILKGMKSRELCDKLGISLTLLSAWETARYVPHGHDVMTWLSILGYDMAVVRVEGDESE